MRISDWCSDVCSSDLAADCDPGCPQTSTAPSPDCDPDCPVTPGAAPTDCDTPGDDCADPTVVVERSVSIAQVACEPTGGDDPGEPEEEVLGTVIERAAPAPAQVSRQALPRTEIGRAHV